MHTIYLITNKNNGKVYVGQTCQELQERWFGHKACSRRGIETHLYRAMRKDGEENFFIEPIYSVVNKKYSNIVESLCIKIYNSKNQEIGYNLTDGGEGCVGYKHTEEFKKQVAENNKKRVWSKESREKVSQSIKKLPKKTLSDEHKRKIGDANRNRIPSSETRLKIGASSKLRASDPETKARFIERMRVAHGRDN